MMSAHAMLCLHVGLLGGLHIGKELLTFALLLASGASLPERTLD
jgi:hypothetical protein